MKDKNEIIYEGHRKALVVQNSLSVTHVENDDWLHNDIFHTQWSHMTKFAILSLMVEVWECCGWYNGEEMASQSWIASTTLQTFMAL